MIKRFILILSLIIIPTAVLAAFASYQTYQPSVVSNTALRQENFFGITGSAWSNFTGNYTPGLGNPAVATDDYYHQNGLSGFRPYDLLDAACGATGASIAASRGRYAWIMAADHGGGHDSVWNGSYDFRIGYSNDPGVPPSRMNYIWSIDGAGVQSNLVTATFTAKIDNGSGSAGNILTVQSMTSGYITSTNTIMTGAGVTTAAMSGQLTGTEGGVGTYTIGGAAQLVSPQTMTVIQNNYFLYNDPQLICNPDDATNPFYIYAEGQANGSGTALQHEMGMIKSADLITWGNMTPTHISKNFNSWSSFQRINRIGTGNWESKGYQVGYNINGNIFARSTWTSTDGVFWQPGTTNLNQCLPSTAQNGTQDNCTGAAIKFSSAQSPYTVTVGGTPWVIGSLNTVNGSTRVGNQWVGRASVNSNQSVTTTPTQVNISSPIAGNYPGPNYLQTTTGYVEDGIAHYYGVRGWTISDSLWFVTTQVPYNNGGRCKAIPPANGNEGYFDFIGTVSGTTLTVNSVTTNSIQDNTNIYGGAITSASNTKIVTQLTGSPGSIGTYQLSNSFTISSPISFFGIACGGLGQQAMDYYTEIVDAPAANGAAPIGVTASCAASVSSLNWFDALPTNTYRLYRGTTAGSQTTLVGDFTGTTATDTGMTLNSITYYKLVYLNGGVEQKNRVVSTYCSTSTAFVNAHMTRALLDGADSTTCNRNGSGLSMDAFDSWLTSNGLQNNLLFATAADFCVKGTVSGAGAVTKVYDMGTTRLPRGGDYTTMTSGVTYNATGVGGKPAWINAANTDKGYYGGDRSYLNNIRRKTQITLFAAYQKPSTNQIRPFASGQFSSAMYLEHSSGTPGTVNCAIFDGSGQKVATATPISATAFNTAACTYDGSQWLAYSNANVGSLCSGCNTLVIPSPTLNPADALTGQIGSGSTSVIVSGDMAGLYGRASGSFIAQGNVAQYSGRVQIIFDIGLTQAQITSLDALVR